MTSKDLNECDPYDPYELYADNDSKYYCAHYDASQPTYRFAYQRKFYCSKGDTYGTDNYYYCKQCYYARFMIWHKYHNQRPRMRYEGATFVSYKIDLELEKDPTLNVQQCMDNNVLPTFFYCDFYGTSPYSFNGIGY